MRAMEGEIGTPVTSKKVDLIEPVTMSTTTAWEVDARPAELRSSSKLLEETSIGSWVYPLLPKCDLQTKITAPLLLSRFFELRLSRAIAAANAREPVASAGSWGGIWLRRPQGAQS